jgi:hypothetical protein
MDRLVPVHFRTIIELVNLDRLGRGNTRGINHPAAAAGPFLNSNSLKSRK